MTRPAPTKSFLAALVMAPVSLADDRFPDLKNKTSARRLRDELLFDPADLGKYVLSVEIKGVEYFFTSDERQVWANGLDSQSMFSNAFLLLDGEDAAVNLLNTRQPRAASRAVLYRLERDGGSVVLHVHSEFDAG